MSAHSTAGVSLFHQPRAVWATAFACVVGFMSIGLVDPILTSIAEGLKATPSQVSLLFTSYFFVTSVMMLVTGFVSSRLGGRRTLLLGAGLIVIFAGLAGTSNSVAELVGFRAGWGLGNAFFVVTALSVIVAVTKGGIGAAVLLYEAAIGLGLSTGPLLGAALGAQSWRYPFFGTATLMAIGFIAILLFLPEQPKPAVKTSLSAPIKALRHPGLLTVSLGGFFYFFAFFTVLAFAPFVLRMSPHAVGLIFFGWGLLLAIFSVGVAPRLQARFGTARSIYGALAILAALLLAMGSGHPMVVAAGVVLSGAVMGVCNTLFTELALEVSDSPRPVASAGYNFVRWMAGVVAPYLAPSIDEHWGVFATFAVAALAAIAAPVIFALRRNTLHRPEEEAIAAPVLAPVLAAIDGSDADAAVLDRAAALAKTAGAPVVALHVLMTEGLGEDASETESGAEAEAITTAALSRLRAAGVEASSHILRASAGEAARSFAAHAASLGARAIVSGIRHTGDLSDLVHGSFAEALTRMVADTDTLVFVGPREQAAE